MAVVVRAAVFLLVVYGLVALAAPAAEVARRAVSEWLSGRYRVNIAEVLKEPPEEALGKLERAVAFPPPPPGLEVNLDEPEVEQRGGQTLVRYPAVVGDQGGEVVVILEEGEVRGVFWRPEGGMLPGWLRQPWAGPVVFFLGVVYLLSLRRGRLRYYWLQALDDIRRRRRLFVATHLVLYGAYLLGALAAYGNPELVKLVQAMVGMGINQIGLEAPAAYGPLGLMAAIFYWNFTHGLVLTTALPGLLFGVPALLVNLARYYLLGLALSPAVVPVPQLLGHLPVIVLELGAYNTATFGALALLGDVLAGRGYAHGFRTLLRSLLPATALLFIAAVYEAFEVLL